MYVLKVFEYFYFLRLVLEKIISDLNLRRSNKNFKLINCLDHL